MNTDKNQIPQNKIFKEELAGFTTVKKITAEWGEMDAAGIVNNTIYLRWFEAARVAYFMEMAEGADYNIMEDVASVVLGHQECKYIFPITFPDTIWIGVRISEILDDRFTMECKMMSEKHNRITTIAKATLVPFHMEKKRKIPVSQVALEQINRMEEKSIF
jgi:acyl-CoA thioester hydrolase